MAAAVLATLVASAAWARAPSGIDAPQDGDVPEDSGAPEDSGDDTDPPAAATVDDVQLAEGPAVLDGVLPSGVRVIVARDVTLPVAAVVLAIETGTEDDPSTLPGLVHALAFHLLQGNRELAPGGATAIVHDGGGLTMLAVGPAQIRFESIVPVSRLEKVVWAEAQRLLAPTVSEVLWRDSLRWAKRDKPRDWSVPRAAVAGAHEAPGIDHAGRSVGPEVSAMTPRAVSTAIAERFQYRKATLTVVAPGPLQETWDMVALAFAGQPSATRQLPARVAGVPTPGSGTVPRRLPTAGANGTSFVWPVPNTAAGALSAMVFCKALNRQRRASDEPSRARVRCTLDLDPRRTTVAVTATGVSDPQDLLGKRLARLDSGSDDALVDAQRRIVLLDDRMALRTPLALARRLAESGGPSPTAAGQARTRSHAEAVGHEGLLSGADAPLRLGAEFSLPAALRLVGEEATP